MSMRNVVMLFHIINDLTGEEWAVNGESTFAAKMP